MPEQDFDVMCRGLMIKLLDLYNMNDWGMTWIEFTEKFTGVMLDTIGYWQMIDLEG